MYADSGGPSTREARLSTPMEPAHRPRSEEAVWVGWAPPTRPTAMVGGAHPTEAMEATMSTGIAARKSLSDPDLKAALQELRRTDNVTNWWYILRTYLYLALVIGGAVWFFESGAPLGLSWWWNVPVAL